MARNIHNYLESVWPSEAVEYVLPLLSELAVDEDNVQEALASDLAATMWWFFSKCQMTGTSSTSSTSMNDTFGDSDPNDSLERPVVSMASISALLATLLISQSSAVCTKARRAVVDLIDRLSEPQDTSGFDSQQIDKDQNALVRQELIQHVVIGMGRLDFPESDEHELLVNEPWIESGDVPRTGSPSNSFLSSSPRSTTTSLADSSNTSSTDPSSGSNDFFGFKMHPVSTSDSSSRQAAPISECVDIPNISERSHSQDLPSTNEEDDSAFISDDTAEEAALGRLCSMSLIAAVTANDKGTISCETKLEFVHEVQRVQNDALSSIRAEAAFAVGALAKVVPDEIAISSLLPLFEAFSKDEHWRVRYSSIFALPNLLARLPFNWRRDFAVSTLKRLSEDSTITVRLAVLEVLGEAIHKFSDSDGDPPSEIIELFLGPATEVSRNSTAVHNMLDFRSVSDIGVSSHRRVEAPSDVVKVLKQKGSGQSLRSLFERKTDNYRNKMLATMDSFFWDPHRPLICAYNYPAVILTLGRGCWAGRLRSYYLELLQDTTYKVRHTLTASLGTIAEIIGPEYTKNDLLGFWNKQLCDDDPHIRLLAVDHLPGLVSLADGVDRSSILSDFLCHWSKVSHGWRERLSLLNSVPALIALGQNASSTAHRFFDEGLRDTAASIRTRAVELAPILFKCLETDAQQSFLGSIANLFHESSHHKRATFIACYLALSCYEEDKIDFDHRMWFNQLSALADDRVVGVRIGVSRLVGVLCNKIYHDPNSRPVLLQALIQHLGKDAERDVRSYIASLLLEDAPDSERDASPSTSFPPLVSFNIPPSISPAMELNISQDVHIDGRRSPHIREQNDLPSVLTPSMDSGAEMEPLVILEENGNQSLPSFVLTPSLSLARPASFDTLLSPDSGIILNATQELLSSPLLHDIADAPHKVEPVPLSEEADSASPTVPFPSCELTPEDGSTPFFEGVSLELASLEEQGPSVVCLQALGDGI